MITEISPRRGATLARVNARGGFVRGDALSYPAAARCLQGYLQLQALMDKTEFMSPVNVSSIGSYIREQREQAKISIRQLAQAAGVSNPYLSQVERGLRRPSADILQQIAKGLRISAEALYVQAGILDERPGETSVTDAIMADTEITERQKQMLMDIYESFRKEVRADAEARQAEAAEAEAEGRPAGDLEAGDLEAQGLRAEDLEAEYLEAEYLEAEELEAAVAGAQARAGDARAGAARNAADQTAGGDHAAAGEDDAHAIAHAKAAAVADAEPAVRADPELEAEAEAVAEAEVSAWADFDPEHADAGHADAGHADAGPEDAGPEDVGHADPADSRSRPSARG